MILICMSKIGQSQENKIKIKTDIENMIEGESSEAKYLRNEMIFEVGENNIKEEEDKNEVTECWMKRRKEVD